MYSGPVAGGKAAAPVFTALHEQPPARHRRTRPIELVAGRTLRDWYAEHRPTLRGLRVGEICALRWIDVDFKAGIVHVRRSIVRGKQGPTKSGKERQVPMSDRLRGALLQHHAKRHAKRVLTRDNGTDLNSDDVPRP